MSESFEVNIIPDRRELKETSLEKAREFFHAVRNMSPAKKLLAMTMAATVPGMQAIKINERQAETAQAYSELQMAPEGISLEGSSGTKAIEKMLLQMPESAADARQEYIDALGKSFDTFMAENSIKGAVEYFPIEEFVEIMYGHEVVRQDAPHEAPLNAKGKNEHILLFDSYAELAGFSSSSQSYIEWQQRMSIMKIEKEKKEGDFEISAAGDIFEITGVGKTENDALLDAVWNAAKFIGSKAAKDTVESMNDNSTDNDGIEKIFSTHHNSVLIKSREVTGVEDVLDAKKEKQGVRVKIVVEPGNNMTI